MWGVASDLTRRAAHALAAEGHRLLLVGDEPNTLEELDARLAQSELHRVKTTGPVHELAAWIQEQNVGLDGLVLFAPPPEPGHSLFVPTTVNLRNAERSLFGVLEVVRGLLPQLRKGKKPKRILVVLDWCRGHDNNPMQAWLERAWQAVLPAVTHELNKEGSNLNVLCLLETTEPATETTHPAPNSQNVSSLGTPNAPQLEESSSAHGSNEAPASDYVHSAVSLIRLNFSPMMLFLNGQFLQHPSPNANLGGVTVRR